jgi:hypothetical protein
MTKFRRARVHGDRLKGASWVTYGLDNQGNIHAFRGKRRLINEGSRFVDEKGHEADVFIQRQDDKEAFLDEVGDKELEAGTYEQRKIEDDEADYYSERAISEGEREVARREDEDEEREDEF